MSGGRSRRSFAGSDLRSLARAGRFGVDDIVGQHYRERLIAHQFHGAQDGVSQSQGFLLPGVRNVDHVGDVAHDGKQILLAPRFKHVFQLEADVKMIFDGAFAAAGDDNDVLNSGMQRLFDTVLNEGFVDQRQHLHRLRLGGGQERPAKPPGREYGFANLGSHYPQYAFGRPVLATNRRIIPQSVQPSRRSRPRQNRGTLPRARPCTSHPRVRWRELRVLSTNANPGAPAGCIYCTISGLSWWARLTSSHFVGQIDIVPVLHRRQVDVKTAPWQSSRLDYTVGAVAQKTQRSCCLFRGTVSVRSPPVRS